MKFSCPAAALFLVLSACGPGGGERAPDGANQAAAANEAAANQSAAAEPDGAAACPFRRTREWVGSVERGHVRIHGYVDVQMAGFRPALTERADAGPGTLALDLAFAPAPTEPINDHVRYERTGAPSYRAAEIWCGGDRIQTIDMIVVN